MARTGADILAQSLVAAGFTHGFHVPGEGVLDLLDALGHRHPGITLVHGRHEAGMAFAAIGHARAGGGVGLCIAGRAPGALNTCLALHTAWTDAVPLLLIIGQAAAAFSEREAFLDGAFHQVFAPLSKWVAQIDDAARIPEMVSRALHVARSGQPGPVVLIVPEEVFRATAEPAILAPPPAIAPAPGAADLAAIAAALAGAERPLLVLGGGGWSDAGLAAARRFAEAQGLPVLVSYRRRDLFDNDHPNFIGELGIGLDPALTGRVGRADLLLVLNMRLGELNTIGEGFHGFSLLAAPRAAVRLIHIHGDAGELNRVYQADQAVLAAPDEAALALAALPGGRDHAVWLAEGRAAYLAHHTGGACPGALDLKAVFGQLRAALPADAILSVGAGAYALWAQRYFPYHRPRTQLGPKSGAMGYGLPAAIGAAMACPERTVVALAGDGCFMMNAEEMATAVHHRLRLVVLVLDNGSYGAIRLGQERAFGRPTGVALTNPDFVDFARSFGARAERVAETADFAPALARALGHDGVSLLHLMVPPEATRPPR